jgi:2-keto-4-pentenoate hydratase/2-oxohepta-3-ene-1,7-dioic acid hydratase in catechol pathway
MQFCRFVPLDTPTVVSPSYGLLDGEKIHELSAAPWFEWAQAPRNWRQAEVRFLAPVEPGKIVCVGRNYAAHAAELGNEMPKEPLIFLKPPSAIIGLDDPIVLPAYSRRVEHEGELALVMGKRCTHLGDDDDPLAFVLGYTCLNDVTARDLQKSDVQFTRAKGFDTFCPVGPYIETDVDPANVLVETYVNNELRQSGNTTLMAYSCAFLVRWISRMMTLYPGDVISTGTPAGVGPVVAGDVVEVKIADIGVLRNPVQDAQA